MKIKEKEKPLNTKVPLTVQEMEHMKLVQKSIDRGEYNPPKSKEATLRSASEMAQNRKS